MLQNLNTQYLLAFPFYQKLHDILPQNTSASRNPTTDVCKCITHPMFKTLCVYHILSSSSNRKYDIEAIIQGSYEVMAHAVCFS